MNGFDKRTNYPAIFGEMYSTSSQSLSTDVAVPASFNNVSVENGVDADLTNNRFNIEKTGWYMLFGKCGFNSTSRLDLSFVHNSTTLTNSVGRVINAPNGTVNSHKMAYLEAGDYVRMYLQSGANASTQASAGLGPLFSIYGLGNVSTQVGGGISPLLLARTETQSFSGLTSLNSLISGLRVSTTSTTASIEPGFCADSSGSVVINAPSPLTANITNPSDRISGLSIGNDTTYYLLLVTDSTQSTVDVLWSDSDSLPAGWTYYRCISYYRTNTTGALRETVMNYTLPRTVMYVSSERAITYNTGSAPTTPTLIDVLTPHVEGTQAMCQISLYSGNYSRAASLSSYHRGPVTWSNGEIIQRLHATVTGLAMPTCVIPISTSIDGYVYLSADNASVAVAVNVFEYQLIQG